MTLQGQNDPELVETQTCRKAIQQKEMKKRSMETDILLQYVRFFIPFH